MQVLCQRSNKRIALCFFLVHCSAHVHCYVAKQLSDCFTSELVATHEPLMTREQAYCFNTCLNLMIQVLRSAMISCSNIISKFEKGKKRKNIISLVVPDYTQKDNHMLQQRAFLRGFEIRYNLI